MPLYNACNPAAIYLFKVNSGNTKAVYELCLKLSLFTFSNKLIA